MIKIYALVVCLGTFMFMSVSHADDSLLSNILKTKQIVRMKLWYDGIEQAKSEPSQNQEVKAIVIKEELNRALNKVDL